MNKLEGPFFIQIKAVAISSTGEELDMDGVTIGSEMLPDTFSVEITKEIFGNKLRLRPIKNS